MVTACAYAEAALLNGTTTIFCDSHEIGNVMDVAGVEGHAGGCARSRRCRSS
jgi:adenine deaminase